MLRQIMATKDACARHSMDAKALDQVPIANAPMPLRHPDFPQHLRVLRRVTVPSGSNDVELMILSGEDPLSGTEYTIVTKVLDMTIDMNPWANLMSVEEPRTQTQPPQYTSANSADQQLPPSPPTGSSQTQPQQYFDPQTSANLADRHLPPSPPTGSSQTQPQQYFDPAPQTSASSADQQLPPSPPTGSSQTQPQQYFDLWVPAPQTSAHLADQQVPPSPPGGSAPTQAQQTIEAPPQMQGLPQTINALGESSNNLRPKFTAIKRSCCRRRRHHPTSGAGVGRDGAGLSAVSCLHASATSPTPTASWPS